MVKIIVDGKQNRQKKREKRKNNLREFFNKDRGANTRFNRRRSRERIFKMDGQKE